MAQQEYINVGTTANDGTGDPLRVAFEKINNNFTNLFLTSTSTSSAYSEGLDPAQVIFEVDANVFTQGTFQVRSNNVDNNDSQDITISAQISTDSANIKYTGYGTTFIGNALSSYSMDVSGGNVRLMADPIANATIYHFIASQITYIGTEVVGMALALNGSTDEVLSTENNFTLSTEQA